MSASISNEIRDRVAAADASQTQVLLVDDEEYVLSALSRRLRGPWKIRCATSADQGLAILNQHPCSIVISDLHMPAKDGIEFFTEVNEQHPETIRIMLTGDLDRTSIIRAINQCNVFRFLNKPCPPESVELALRDAIEFHRFRQTSPIPGAAGQASEVASPVVDDVEASELPASSSRDAERSREETSLTGECSSSDRAETPGGAAAKRLGTWLAAIAGPSSSVRLSCDLSVNLAQLPIILVGRVLGILTARLRDTTHGEGRLCVHVGSIDAGRTGFRLHPGATPGRYLTLELSNLDWHSPPEIVRATFKRLFHRFDGQDQDFDDLETVAELVGEHQGWIQIQSSSDSVALIRVYLPVLSGITSNPNQP